MTDKEFLEANKEYLLSDTPSNESTYCPHCGSYHYGEGEYDNEALEALRDAEARALSEEECWDGDETDKIQY